MINKILESYNRQRIMLLQSNLDSRRRISIIMEKKEKSLGEDLALFPNVTIPNSQALPQGVLSFKNVAKYENSRMYWKIFPLTENLS